MNPRTMWEPVATAPTDGRQVLACFKGQFKWQIFIAYARQKSHGGVQAIGYATATHWMPMPELPEESNTDV